MQFFGPIAARLMRFRHQLLILWDAFRNPATPIYLKAAMIGLVVYVISPIDLIPDIFAFIGWIDDALIVAFVVNWIVSQLPRDVHTPEDQNARKTTPHNPGPFDATGPVIDGTARRN